MLELGTFGSVRGVPGDGYPYRNPRSEAGLANIAVRRANPHTELCLVATMLETWSPSVATMRRCA